MSVTIIDPVKYVIVTSKVLLVGACAAVKLSSIASFIPVAEINLDLAVLKACARDVAGIENVVVLVSTVTVS